MEVGVHNLTPGLPEGIFTLSYSVRQFWQQKIMQLASNRVVLIRRWWSGHNLEHTSCKDNPRKNEIREQRHIYPEWLAWSHMQLERLETPFQMARQIEDQPRGIHYTIDWCVSSTWTNLRLLASLIMWQGILMWKLCWQGVQLMDDGLAGNWDYYRSRLKNAKNLEKPWPLLKARHIASCMPSLIRCKKGFCISPIMLVSRIDEHEHHKSILALLSLVRRHDPLLSLTPQSGLSRHGGPASQFPTCGDFLATGFSAWNGLPIFYHTGS